MTIPFDMRVEMWTVVDALVQSGPTVPESLSIQSSYGRHYKASFVKPGVEEDEWIPTTTREKGTFRCEICHVELPGANWIRVILTNGMLSLPEAILSEHQLHILKKHPREAEEMLHEPIYFRVFASAVLK